MEELRSFRKFLDMDQAHDVAKILEENSIINKLVEVSASLDATFGGGRMTKQIEIQILQADFEKANKILEKNAEILIQDVEKDYHLFEFSNEELYDILLQPDQWSNFDYKLAIKILADRGEMVNKSLLNNLKNKRIAILSQPEESQPAWIILGYFSSLIGGLIGIAIGWHLWTGSKTLPDGNKTFSYNEKDRKHGRNIFIIGLIILPIFLFLRIYSEI